MIFMMMMMMMVVVMTMTTMISGLRERHRRKARNLKLRRYGKHVCARVDTICAPRVENLRDIWISAYCNLPMRGSGWSIDLSLRYGDFLKTVFCSDSSLSGDGVAMPRSRQI